MVELDIPKVGKKPTEEQLDNLKQGAEAMAAHEDKMILETLHTPHLTMGSPADDDLHVKMTKEIEDTVKEAFKKPSKESDRLRLIEQESASYMEDE